MRVTELHEDDVYSNGEEYMKVLYEWDGETTVFIKGPGAYRVMRGPNDTIVKLVDALMATSDDYDTIEEYNADQDAFWSNNHEGLRIVSARPDDVDFDPNADYCNHDTEYMLDCETGELYDL